jgi:predicted transcriptional regulator
MARSYARGSGAILTTNVLGEHVVTGGGVCTTVHGSSLSEGAVEAPVPAAQMISTVRSELSLNIKELSTIIGVERPTIYAWLSGRTTPYLRNRRRLQELYRIALAWGDMSSTPVGDAVRWEDETGKSILGLLREAQTNAILARLKALSSRQARASSDRQARRERLLRFTEEHDLKRDLDKEQETLDIATGKRRSPE